MTNSSIRAAFDSRICGRWSWQHAFWPLQPG